MRREVRKRIEILGSGGGLDFNTVHNVQAQVPIENVLVMHETLQAHGTYC